MTKQTLFRIKGTHFYDAETSFHAEKLLISDRLKLILEPENKIDQHAIQVWRGNDLLGYIPRNKTWWIAFLIENNKIKQLSLKKIEQKLNLINFYACLTYDYQKLDSIRFWAYFIKRFFNFERTKAAKTDIHIKD